MNVQGSNNWRTILLDNIFIRPLLAGPSLALSMPTTPPESIFKVYHRVFNMMLNTPLAFKSRAFKLVQSFLYTIFRRTFFIMNSHGLKAKSLQKVRTIFDQIFVSGVLPSTSTDYLYLVGLILNL